MDPDALRAAFREMYASDEWAAADGNERLRMMSDVGMLYEHPDNLTARMEAERDAVWARMDAS